MITLPKGSHRFKVTHGTHAVYDVDNSLHIVQPGQHILCRPSYGLQKAWLLFDPDGEAKDTSTLSEDAAMELIAGAANDNLSLSLIIDTRQPVIDLMESLYDADSDSR